MQKKKRSGQWERNGGEEWKKRNMASEKMLKRSLIKHKIGHAGRAAARDESSNQRRKKRERDSADHGHHVRRGKRNVLLPI